MKLFDKCNAMFFLKYIFDCNISNNSTKYLKISRLKLYLVLQIKGRLFNLKI